MSDLQSIATKLRVLSKDSGKTGDAVRSTERQLRSLVGEVNKLKRSGVDTGKLSGAILEAEAKAKAAAHAAKTVQSKGAQWADMLAAGGTASAGGAVSASGTGASGDQRPRTVVGIAGGAMAGLAGNEAISEGLSQFAEAAAAVISGDPEIGRAVGDVTGHFLTAIDLMSQTGETGAVDYVRALWPGASKKSTTKAKRK